jgi:hypothetical protein
VCDCSHSYTIHCACAILYLWPTWLYNIFQHYPINGMIFEKLSNIKFVFQFFLILRTEEDMVKNVYWSPCKVLVILVRFCWNFNFFDTFFKNTQTSNFTKICPERAQVLPCRQTWESLFTILWHMPKRLFLGRKKYWMGICPSSPSYTHYFLNKYGCSTICPISNMVLPVRRVCLREVVCTEWRCIFCRQQMQNTSCILHKGSEKQG